MTVLQSTNRTRRAAIPQNLYNCMQVWNHPNMKIWGLCFAICIGFSGVAAGADGFNCSVGVSIPTQSDAKSEIESFVKRELRALGNVTVVSGNPDYTLEIVCMELKTTAGIKTGYALSVVIKSHTYNSNLLSSILQEKLPQSAMGIVHAFGDHVVAERHHGLSVAASDGLKASCESIVARFDAEILDADREQWRKFQDFMKKSSEPNAGKPKG